MEEFKYVGIVMCMCTEVTSTYIRKKLRIKMLEITHEIIINIRLKLKNRHRFMSMNNTIQKTKMSNTEKCFTQLWLPTYLTLQIRLYFKSLETLQIMLSLKNFDHCNAFDNSCIFRSTETWILVPNVMVKNKISLKPLCAYT